ncbi:DUF2062 domain-containing protein [Chrysiogenes arsenatis]|uniref:DUF2062 domain-containing protein n=1 Tax=Chrysiogenes arsenatis TaxID=309797 RepID=UPI000423D608|nr:DUF2062 domain-containing protein [Chrysiogenes arsenatis]
MSDTSSASSTAKTTLVVVPLYNHGDTIRSVVTEVLTYHPHVMVVDDGSTDGGAETITDLPITLLRHAENQGKGVAIQTAAQAALEQGMSHIITIDADGQHSAADLPAFFAAIAQSPEDIIVGHRDFDSPNVPESSKFGRSFSNFWLRLQTGKALTDTQSGFRAYPLILFEHLRFQQSRYAFEIEVLVKSAWAGIRLRSIPIAVYYPPAQERVSHFDKFWDNARLTVLNTGLTMRSVLPWPHRKITYCQKRQQKVSVLRPLQSIRQLLTENHSPRELAIAGGMGIVLGTLPLIAMHTIAILMISNYLRLNKVIAVSTSQLCMPPLVPAICIEIGYYLRHGHFLTEFTIETLGYQAHYRLWEWFIGSLIFAPVFAVIIGGSIYLSAHMIQQGIAHGRQK